MSPREIMNDMKARARAVLDRTGERLAALIDKEPHVRYDRQSGRLYINPRLEAYARKVIEAEAGRVLREEIERAPTG